MQESRDAEADTRRRIGGGMIAALWLLLLIGGSLLIQQWLDRRNDLRAPETVIDGNGVQLILQDDALGHFQLTGHVNGVEIPFLVDTGASGISIPAHLADELGLRRGRGERVVTANGTVRVSRTVIDELVIGPFTRQKVAAHLNPGMRDVALLGMSFLRHYSLSQENGVLTIAN